MDLRWRILTLGVLLLLLRCRRLLNFYGFKKYVSTSTWWMTGNFGVDVWDPLELNCNYFGDPLISHLALLLSQDQRFLKYFGPWASKRMTFSSQYHLPVNYQMSGRAKINMNQLRKCFFFLIKWNWIYYKQKKHTKKSNCFTHTCQ